MPTTILELSQILQELLINDADQIGRDIGFIIRERKLTGASFVQSLVFGWQANPKASLEDLCQSASACGVTISPQGLQERMNSPQACEFLHAMLMQAMTYLVEANGGRQDLLAQFNGVYLQDSSKVELPMGLHAMWQANIDGQASLKIQTVFDYQHGTLQLTLATGRQHDCPLQTTELPSGSLRLADIGYFKVKVFEDLNQRGVYWITRLPARVGIWMDGHSVHFATWLKQQSGDYLDQIIELSTQRLSCRLIAIRVPESVAQQRRKRVITEAKDRTHSQLQPETFALCDWSLFVTNMPPEQLTIDDALCLIRTRWQIELLFKLWKDELLLDEWRSQQPFQILCEVYAKLLLALIQHWMLILSCWDQEDRSLVKATRALRKHAFHILCALSNLQALYLCLSRILPTLLRCRVQKRKARPATFQHLARASP